MLALADYEPCGLEADGECCEDTWDIATPEQQDHASEVAAYLLGSWSGRRYGLCEVTVRPCGKNCPGFSTFWGSPNYWMTPMLTSGGFWINCLQNSCRCNPCDCCHVCEQDLDGPVNSVVQVLIDGAVVPASEYRIDNEDRLTRVGGGCWPVCQDLSLPDTEPNTWSITYLKGEPLPAAGQRALNILACEILKLCLNQSGCRLPFRWRSITRENIAMDALDDFADLERGRIGIFEVDSFLAATNPYGIHNPPAVYPVESPARTRYRTWP